MIVAWRRLGVALVDSATILIADPCYVDTGFDYEAVCAGTHNERRGGEVILSGTHGTGVVVGFEGGVVWAGCDAHGVVCAIVVIGEDDDQEGITPINLMR